MSDRGTGPGRGGGWVWVGVQSVLLTGLVVAGPAGAGAWHSMAGVILGGLLFGAGGWIGIAGVVVLGRNRTPFPGPRPGSELVTRGVYGWVRHPLYVSLMVAGAGWGLLWQSGWALGVVMGLGVFLDRKAREEERRLREAFPEYGEYAARVRRFLPGMY
ncbi:MAG: isoprenylcysteine carboxylmethyltransferase family protein [Verrucomicrobiae bacterium]|nr:isoprenylcysteine carboxylmethyltransferase family protein [Verrucomicrobiae bacterium]